MHASVASFRMSSTLSKPDTTALSAHRRVADQNAILCAAQQKRFGDPPRRARNGRLHHRHPGRVINSSQRGGANASGSKSKSTAVWVKNRGGCGCRTREPRCRMPLRQTMSSAGSSGASPIHAGASMMLERFERGPLRDCGARFSISRHRSPDNGFSRRAPDASLSGGLCDDEREARCPA